MKQVKLGNGDLLVSRISVGCWSFGGDRESYWGEQPQDEVNALVSEALESGINLFDTAFGYNDGSSELSLGLALKGKRSRAVICNKIPSIDYDELPNYEKKVTDSLKRLDTDYIDLLMIHWPSADRSLMAENLLKLDSMRQKGYIRYAGVSNFGMESLELARSLGVPLTANEFAYNVISRAIEYEILPYCIEHSISVAAYMPILQGVLTGKYATVDEIPPRRKRTVHFNSATSSLATHGGSGAEPEVMAVIGKLVELSDAAGLSAGQLALAWALSKKGVATAMVGCRNIGQLKENASAAEAVIAADVIAALDEISLPVWRKLGNIPDLWLPLGKSRIW